MKPIKTAATVTTVAVGGGPALAACQAISAPIVAAAGTSAAANIALSAAALAVGPVVFVVGFTGALCWIGHCLGDD